MRGRRREAATTAATVMVVVLSAVVFGGVEAAAAKRGWTCVHVSRRRRVKDRLMIARRIATHFRRFG